MRPRARSYKTLDGLSAGKNAVQWYWRLAAMGSTLMILGGFLMLPVTFDRSPQLRVSKAVLGIFAVALLTAGFSLTALLCFAVRNSSYHAEVVFLPSLVTCAVGLLTIFYDFLISSRFVWNVPALLLTITAAISTITYGGLFIFASRKVSINNARTTDVQLNPRSDLINGGRAPYQSSSFYDNYIRNMYPTSAAQQQQQQQQGAYDPHSITEEEMQRQQLLMLLLQREQPPTPDPSQSTFRIDWQGQEDLDSAPVNGYYAPDSATPQSAYVQSAYSQTAYPNTAYPPQTASSQAWGQGLRPWDGIWRGPGGPPTSAVTDQWQRADSPDLREARRREIEMGR